MENLLSQRFNVFVVLFVLIVLTAATCTDNTNSGVILAVGFLVSLMVWMPLYRTYVKHCWIMEEYIYKAENHPAKIVSDETKRRGLLSHFSESRWMGVVIPAVCCGILMAAAVGLFCGIL